MKDRSPARLVFDVLNHVFLLFLGLLCVLPFVHVISISFSSAIEASANRVLFWPREFQTFPYVWLFRKPEIWSTMRVSLMRVVVGYVVNMVLILLTAYPLSKESSHFKPRTVYVWFFFFTILFSGGMVPTFLIVKYTGLMGNFFALIIPGAVQVWNIVLMLNFFRNVPKELEEAAFLDGAGHVRTLFSIYVPVSLPAIATISLFVILGHWNAWFDGFLYLNDIRSYPFQTYLRTLVASTNMGGITNMMEIEDILKLADKNVKAAQITLGAVPIFIIYPFLQRYFVAGIVIGSVKG